MRNLQHSMNSDQGSLFRVSKLRKIVTHVLGHPLLHLLVQLLDRLLIRLLVRSFSRPLTCTTRDSAAVELIWLNVNIQFTTVSFFGYLSNERS